MGRLSCHACVQGGRPGLSNQGGYRVLFKTQFKLQGDKVDAEQRSPGPFLPLSEQPRYSRGYCDCLQTIANRVQVSLGAKCNLDKRNNAGYSVSNGYSHSFFLIAFSIDNRCQNEHFPNDAGKTVCQTVTPSECYCTDLVLGSVSGPKNFHRHSIQEAVKSHSPTFSIRLGRV